jgi:ureidoglycolate hydrolase
MIPIVDTAEQVARYGRLVSAAAVEHQPELALQWWPELASFEMTGRTADLGLARVTRGTWTVPRIERHVQTSELLIPFGGNILVPVAPPDTSRAPADAAALEATIQAVLVRVGEALILGPGVWHAPAFPVEAVAYYWCLLRRGTGAEDVEYAVFDSPLPM